MSRCYSRMDRISELPDNVIEMIILRLPSLLDAVRTSILSKKWQYKWATLSTLSFGKTFYEAIFRHRTLTTVPGVTYPYLVKSILLQYIGRLKSFIIYIPGSTPSSIGKFNLTIRVALMKGVEELSVWNHPSSVDSVPYPLPSFLFSCGDQLTRLELIGCVFNPPHGLRGFSNLNTLNIYWLKCSNSEILSDFISSCPKLHTLGLFEFDNSNEHLCLRIPSVKGFNISGSIGSIIIQEPWNLVSLSVCMTIKNVDYQKHILSDDYMLNFFSNLGKIEYLCIGGCMLQVLGGDCAPRKLSTELNNLKTIKVIFVNFVNLGNKREVDCLLLLIRSSPNLQLLDITLKKYIRGAVENVCDAIAGEYLDWCFQRLRTVRIREVGGIKSELKMIEILLSCSPVLQVMSIRVDSKLDKDAKLELSKELMRFRRCSTKAEIICTYDE